MKFGVIICTFQRPEAIGELLNSIGGQEALPHQIIVIDGSLDTRTEEVVRGFNLGGLEYFHVREEHRGLTKQRNYGISELHKEVEIVHFLDDDVVLEPDYFQTLNSSYEKIPEALGVGGYITNEINWEEKGDRKDFDEFYFEGWKRKLGSRNILRKRIGLLSKEPPGKMPDFSNALSISFFPPSGKIYPVDFFMGCAMSFRKEIFDHLQFSEYFYGYGLYEDLDFCIQVSKRGPLFLNTAARLEHYHAPAGRPDHYKYGVMVIRNGWYVWRKKYTAPGIKARVKWHLTAGILALVRLGNAKNKKQRKAAVQESLGRFVGWWSLLFKKPPINL